jgi:small subunit ribosomal protein S6
MNKNIYELVVLLHPDLEIDAETPIKKVEGLITAVGGQIIKRDNWGKRRLAYKIKKQDFAIYVYFEIKVDPSKVRDLENTILITEEVLRHILVVHVEDVKKAEKADKAEKDDKDDKAEKPSKAEDKDDDKSETEGK